jgi:PKD repeat protein
MLARKILIVLAIPFVFVTCDKDDEDKPVVASFTVDKTKANIGEIITFTNNSQNASTYEWDFGDGKAIVSEEDPTYIYDEAGNYVVELKAVGSSGSNTSTRELLITQEEESGTNTPSIFPGRGIGNYEVLEEWINIKELFSSEYTHYADDIIEIEPGFYFHPVDIIPEQTAMYILSTNSTNIQDNDIVWYLIVYGDYSGITEDEIGIGSTMAFVVETYGYPTTNGIDDGDNYLGYWYYNLGVAFYSQGNIITDIWIFPPDDSGTKSTSVTIPEHIKRLRNSIVH